MFRGEYLKTLPSGLFNRYQSGDTILFEGNIYQAVKNTYLSPFQEPNSWKYTGNHIIYFSNTPPINPKEGQQWEKDGIVYTYIYDGDNFSWVEF